MPSVPYAKAQVAINGGAWLENYASSSVPNNAVLSFNAETTAGWQQSLWQFYNWEISGTPAGWTKDPTTGLLYYAGTAGALPPNITLDGTSWGFWLLKLTINGGAKGGIPNNPDCIDYTLCFDVPSPTVGMDEVGFGEGTQREPQRAWIRALQNMQKLLDTAMAAASGNNFWQTGTDTNYQITGTKSPQLVIVPPLTAARTWKMPTAPSDGMPVGIYDARGVLVNAGNTLSVTTPGGTDHFFVGGVDKGTTWQIDAALFKGGTAMFTRRASTSTWELAP